MGEATHPPSTAPNRRYGVLALLILGAVVYASLAPFRLQMLSPGQAIEQFRGLRLMDPGLALGSGGHGLVFLALYLGLGFATTAAIGAGRPGWPRGFAALGVLAGGAALAVLLEIAKFASPPRAPSLVYVMLEWLGLAIGTMGWLALAGPGFPHPDPATFATRTQRLAPWCLAAYLLALLVVQFWPFDFVPGRAVIARKYAEGRLRVIPFSDPGTEIQWLTSWNQAGAARRASDSEHGPAAGSHRENGHARAASRSPLAVDP